MTYKDDFDLYDPNLDPYTNCKKELKQKETQLKEIEGLIDSIINTDTRTGVIEDISNFEYGKLDTAERIKKFLEAK